MRWYYVDPRNPAEVASRNQTVERIDAWWRAFAAQAPQIIRLFQRQAQWDLPQWMLEHLNPIAPPLCWEFGPAVQGDGHRLVITAESHRHLRPIVRTILERAPRLPGWEFYDYRLPESPDMLANHVEQRTGIAVAGAVATAAGGVGRKIDLTFHFPQARGAALDELRHAAFVATECLLGEQMLDDWIGTLDVVGSPQEFSSRPLDLTRLASTVRATAQSLYERLPAVPLFQITGDEQFASIQVEPSEPADDYPARSDLIVLTTCRAEVLEIACRGLMFASRCHSRCHEYYCYLKIDAQQVPTKQRVEFRGNLEDLIDPALRQAGVGATLGGGSGLRYAYIDLAVVDVGRAAAILQQLLPSAGIPARSWLQFFDDELAHEWIAMHPQAPPPPMPRFESE